jgi:hypothetical protein
VVSYEKSFAVVPSRQRIGSMVCRAKSLVAVNLPTTIAVGRIQELNMPNTMSQSMQPEIVPAVLNFMIYPYKYQNYNSMEHLEQKGCSMFTHFENKNRNGNR